MRVLVVDDHRNTRESLALGLRALGYESEVAGSAAEALARLDEGGYRWLVTDVRMAGTNGLELAPAARSREPQLGLILMTADDVTEDERRVIETLGALLVIKPVTAATLALLCSRLRTSSIEGKEAHP